MADTTARGGAHLQPHHAHAPLAAGHEAGHQQHPLRVYFIVWGWLFVLSTCSYMVDYIGLQGYLRWFLILLFMILKAGLIVAFFMHMAWERRALVYAILFPMFAVLVFSRAQGLIGHAHDRVEHEPDRLAHEPARVERKVGAAGEVVAGRA